jgi:hypothetical protein
MANKPLVAKIHLGDAEAGTHAYGVTDEHGHTHKEIVDEITVNEKLTPPPDAIEAILIGAGKVNVEAGIDNTIVRISKNRFRSNRIFIDTIFTQMDSGTITSESPKA